jgi:hypothetical protein
MIAIGFMLAGSSAARGGQGTADVRAEDRMAL